MPIEALKVYLTWQFALKFKDVFVWVLDLHRCMFCFQRDSFFHTCIEMYLAAFLLLESCVFSCNAPAAYILDGVKPMMHLFIFSNMIIVAKWYHRNNNICIHLQDLSNHIFHLQKMLLCLPQLFMWWKTKLMADFKEYHIYILYQYTLCFFFKPLQLYSCNNSSLMQQP